jgi:hypothetical protein
MRAPSRSLGMTARFVARKSLSVLDSSQIDRDQRSIDAFADDAIRETPR